MGLNLRTAADMVCDAYMSTVATREEREAYKAQREVRELLNRYEPLKAEMAKLDAADPQGDVDEYLVRELLNTYRYARELRKRGYEHNDAVARVVREIQAFLGMPEPKPEEDE